MPLQSSERFFDVSSDEDVPTSYKVRRRNDHLGILSSSEVSFLEVRDSLVNIDCDVNTVGQTLDMHFVFILLVIGVPDAQGIEGQFELDTSDLFI